MTLRNVLFDLDGTLTDPAEGIVRSIQYALDILQLPCPSPAELTAYIGPPLRECFFSICKSSDEVLIEQAVSVFRERFSTVGLFENTPYPDVEQMLDQLANSFQLFVATSKPEIYAKQILDHFSLSSHFVEVHGNDLEGSFDNKADILRGILERRSLKASETIMVGDRKHDVIAAKANGLLSVAVTYGYGSLGELVSSGPDYIINSPGELGAKLIELSLDQ